MALTPEQIDLLADKYVVGLFQQLESEVIGDIARRVRATGRLTETAELMAKSMVEQGYSANKIRADVMRAMRADKALQDEIAINTKEYKEFVTSEIKATVKAAKQAGNDLVADAGMMAYNNDLSMWEQAGQSLSKPNSLNQIMDAFRKQTANELRNLTKTTGFKGTVLQPVMSAYQREMDMALVKLATGTFSYDQICNDVVHNLAQSGLRTIDYASGRSYQLDTAARMSVRTGMSQLSGRITEANIESTGVDLVITSQHMGSRPEHAEWQNKVFCYKGKTKKYPNFVEATGYGTVTGLKGANCSHDFYPFWEGISVKVPDVKEPAPVMVDGKEYNFYSASQKQRQMERNIRATKREIEAQKAIGGDTSVLQANLRKQTADYKKFSVDVGIRAKDNRLRVVGGSSAKKVAKTSNNGTIKETISDVRKSLINDYGNVEYKEVNKLSNPLTSDEIINRLCGGDMTGGSCSSLGFAYIGNKNGLDVLDFRGGKSREFFSRNTNIQKMLQLPNVNGSITKVQKEISGTIEVIKNLEYDKEYYLAVGRHVAIIRNTEKGAEYLELQSKLNNGWTSFKNKEYGSMYNTLYKRFGCRKSVDKLKIGETSMIFEKDVVLMDVDSFKDNEEFRKVLGYINTSVDAQKKGVMGNVK